MHIWHLSMKGYFFCHSCCYTFVVSSEDDYSLIMTSKGHCIMTHSNRIFTGFLGETLNNTKTINHKIHMNVYKKPSHIIDNYHIRYIFVIVICWLHTHQSRHHTSVVVSLLSFSKQHYTSRHYAGKLKFCSKLPYTY